MRLALPRCLRQIAALAVLAALSACAGQQPHVDARLEARQYATTARAHYTAPGTAADPWGPYVNEASARFDIPQTWIRGVMHQESGGLQFMSDGTLTISDKGAMGLMQVMPETYDELRGRYNLGSDPYDPHANILAGTAYMREMYDLYGSPGFLAAYNGGPARLDKYLAGTASLPDETRRYVAMIGPGIQGVWPVNRSPAEQLALNRLPLNIAPGLRYARATAYAANGRRGRHGERAYASRNAAHGGTRYAAASVARVAFKAPAGRSEPIELAAAAPRGRGGFHLISAAMAEPIPLRKGGGTGWAVQVGAYGSASQARSAADSARGAAGGKSSVGTVHSGRATLYRARLTGLSREAAMSACARARHGACLVIAPDAQS